jgi:hypothetical protein
MKLTNEQIQEILDDAPGGADEFFMYQGVANYIDNRENGHQFKIWCEDEQEWVFSELVDGWQYIRGRRSLSDLAEILKLNIEIEQLKAQIEQICNEESDGVNDV